MEEHHAKLQQQHNQQQHQQQQQQQSQLQPQVQPQVQPQQQLLQPSFVIPQGVQIIQAPTGEFIMMPQAHFQQPVIHPVGQAMDPSPMSPLTLESEPAIQPVRLPSPTDNKEKKSKRSRNRKNKNKKESDKQPAKNDKVAPSSPKGESSAKKECWKTCGNWRDAPAPEIPTEVVEPTTPESEDDIPSVVSKERQVRKKIVRMATREISRLLKSATNPNTLDGELTEPLETDPEWAEKCVKFSQAKGNYNKSEHTGMLEPFMTLAPTDSNAVAWPAGRGRPLPPAHASQQRLQRRIPLPKTRQQQQQPQLQPRLNKSDDDDSSIGDGGSCDSTQALTSVFSSQFSTQFSM
eukprot:TRINITY_DN5755_c0_g1_i2.p1 TRINITY_DN5755_c0_g1~~TRINITY_DN5755_c0_g1_i2.p1  ORF type:complete len:349 (+),score=83.08 TRINITY_DN5755_c0_g1_i2:630-1676(+)